jgi:hypothetical protein
MLDTVAPHGQNSKTAKAFSAFLCAPREAPG